jgi:acyl-coenzyme A thioesterase PaaI-like protein
LNISFKGTIIQQGKRQDVVESKVYNENNELCAHAVGTFVASSSIEIKESKE